MRDEKPPRRAEFSDACSKELSRGREDGEVVQGSFGEVDRAVALDDWGLEKREYS